MLIFENSTDKLDLLKDAINNKTAISFWYVGKDFKEKKKHGQNPKQNWRRVEPFALGKSKKGEWILRAYQYGGATNSENKVYKTFSVDEIKDGTIKSMFDKTGENLQTFEPKTYIDNRGVNASFRSNGSDKSMGGGVDTYYNVNKQIKPTVNVTNKRSNVHVNVNPNLIKTKLKPNPIEPIKPVEKEPTKEPKITPLRGLKKPTVPIQKPEPPVEPEIQDDKITPQELEPDQEDSEWEAEPITESTGFLKWIINLNHGSK